MVRQTRSAVDWLFRSRRTGRITVAQMPNRPLLVWLGATAVSVLFQPAGDWKLVWRVVGSSALVIWAADEMIRGVNPWRRMLGAGVLAALAVSWIRS